MEGMKDSILRVRSHFEELGMIYSSFQGLRILLRGVRTKNVKHTAL
jgi:hypothetical protein